MSARPIIPSWAETFFDLHSAGTVEDLWGVLIAWHGIRGSSSWQEPYLLFMRFHRDQPNDAEATAALLCTDYRWRHASRHLIDRLCESGVLDAEQLDVLADWFGGDAFEIDVQASRSPTGGETISTLQRPIWPPLRRWAARRQVERQPEQWRDVIDAASTLPARDAAATVAGVMDAAQHVAPGDLPTLVAVGTAHGSGTVRLATLPVLAITAGVDAALTQAHMDPSPKVRAWKPRRAPRHDRDATPGAPVTASPPSADGQTTLFD